MTAYYNEHDKNAAAWLRELIKDGLIADGEVDERSIEDVKPSELLGFTQCHFFAGIGVWSYALRKAGWPDDRPVWTGSCPCQPFSAAGKGKGITDERHLWPAFYHLIRQCKPSVVFGEQVASKDGLGWLDIVQADLEAARYSVGAVDLCAAGFGAPHIRQRLYWVADSQSDGRQQWQSDAGWGFIGNGEGQAIRLGRNGAANGMANAASQQEYAAATGGLHPQLGGSGHVDGMADASNNGHASTYGLRKAIESPQQAGANSVGQFEGGGNTDGMADADVSRLQGRQGGRDCSSQWGAWQGGMGLQRQPGPTNGFWGAADWLQCRDGKWRAVESGTFPLVDGTSARVGRLRGYGNAIVAPVAQAFIESYLEAIK
jgi:DNA (cytosine-5)-methyltransferase 1